MTLPNERTRAVQMAREFMRDLLDPKATPKVPKEIRTRAYWVLRHFPADYEIRMAAEVLPDTFAPPVVDEDNPCGAV